VFYAVPEGRSDVAAVLRRLAVRRTLPASGRRGGRGARRWVCYLHAPPGPVQQEALRVALRRAMLRPERYLAAALAEWTDEVLAVELGCSPRVLWRLRLMGWPRADRWETDVQLMAEALGVETGRLAALLRALSRTA
jgi:hypothetical protein